MLRAVVVPELPQGWRISGWGPEGEGVEAIGPQGQLVMAATREGLARAIRDVAAEENTHRERQEEAPDAE